MFRTAKQQVIFIGASVILTTFSLASIVNFTDPLAASWVTFASFYASLFLLALGLFTLVGLGIRQWLTPKLYVLNLSSSFRQALLIALLLTVSLLLLSQRLLFWWVELTLMLFFLAIEIFWNLKL